MRRPTRNDVARHAQVSGATVSRVLSGRKDLSISSETRHRVLTAAERLGYRPNQSARALVTGRTNLVALWMQHLRSPFHAHVAHLLAFQNRPPAYQILVAGIESGLMPFPDSAGGGHATVDGIIAHECPDSVRAFLRAHPGPLPPIVGIGAYYVDSIDFVGVDLYAGQVEATRHLYTVGCRRIAFLVNEGSSGSGEARPDGYNAVIREAGLEPEYILTPGEDQTRATARQTVQDYVMARGRPDGIICLNDDMAIGANRALRELGLKVPDDVCLVGCDGIEDTEYQVPALSTIVQPLAHMCALAWQYVQARMEDPGIALQQTVLPARLLIRASSQR
jgi:LacI family transcriptional regulator